MALFKLSVCQCWLRGCVPGASSILSCVDDCSCCTCRSRLEQFKLGFHSFVDNVDKHYVRNVTGEKITTKSLLANALCSVDWTKELNKTDNCTWFEVSPLFMVPVHVDYMNVCSIFAISRAATLYQLQHLGRNKRCRFIAS